MTTIRPHALNSRTDRCCLLTQLEDVWRWLSQLKTIQPCTSSVVVYLQGPEVSKRFDSIDDFAFGMVFGARLKFMPMLQVVSTSSYGVL